MPRITPSALVRASAPPCRRRARVHRDSRAGTRCRFPSADPRTVVGDVPEAGSKGTNAPPENAIKTLVGVKGVDRMSPWRRHVSGRRLHDGFLDFTAGSPRGKWLLSTKRQTSLPHTEPLWLAPPKQTQPPSRKQIRISRRA